MNSLNDAALALETGTRTSRDLLEACLARITDPAGEGARAFTKVYADQARASADAMDALRRAGRAPGRYAGIPISIKDLFDVAGEPTPAASVILADAPPAKAHAAIVQRLLAAGLVLVGRTNMTEFAFSGIGINPHYGTPLSPYDRATGRVPGGSSSGAAVSVADGMALAAIGTDTGGSCRIPAAFCGVVGYKPTARRVPLDGVLPLAPSLDSVGPLANTVACCGVVDAILAGQTPPEIARIPVHGLRLAIPTNIMLDGMDAATERAIDRAVQHLDRAGALIDRRDFAAIDMLQEALQRGSLPAVEAFAWHRDLLARDSARYDRRVAERILLGARMDAAGYMGLVAARADLQAVFAAEMAPYDALLLPTVPIAPPPVGAFATDEAYWRLNGLILRNPAIVNFFDGCAISLPCHALGAPPAGLMLAAPAMRDSWLLAVARAVEEILNNSVS
jgi:aspartyl-tRNA(Asn)/glutamyl-tRNA(Gln) amidotransferase subunit A